jgi:hypothetical protein
MTDFAAGFFAPWIIYALILMLHLVIPACKVKGYVADAVTGRPLEYRLNGPLVLVALALLWVLFARTGVLAWDWLYVHRWSGLIGSGVLGVLFSLAVVLRAPKTGRSLLADLYFGRAANLQYFGRRVDAKMFLYLVGASMLVLNLLSFTAHHILKYGDDFSPGVLLYCILFGWFALEYLVFERVHLYTYDIFAERVGFKLGWGCFTFYPYFYAIGLWAVAHRPDPGTPWWLLVIYALVFFTGWAISRGANMQKYYFKTRPEHVFLGSGRRLPHAPLQRVLAGVKARELLGRDPGSGGAYSGAGLCRSLDSLALSSVLRGPLPFARAGRRAALRGQVWRALDGVCAQRTAADHPLAVLKARRRRRAGHWWFSPEACAC